MTTPTTLGILHPARALLPTQCSKASGLRPILKARPSDFRRSHDIPPVTFELAGEVMHLAALTLQSMCSLGTRVLSCWQLMYVYNNLHN